MLDDGVNTVIGIDFVVSIVATEGMEVMINRIEKRRDVCVRHKSLQDTFEKLVGLGVITPELLIDFCAV